MTLCAPRRCLRCEVCNINDAQNTVMVEWCCGRSELVSREEPELNVYKLRPRKYSADADLARLDHICRRVRLQNDQYMHG